MRTPAFAQAVLDGRRGDMTRRFQNMIARSISTDEGNSLVIVPGMLRSGPEIKRRFAILENWYRVFAVDLKWSYQRCMDELPHALRATLDGTKYEPGARKSW